MACSVAHMGGSVVALGSTVLVGGGFDPATGMANATDVVDAFTFTAL